MAAPTILGRSKHWQQPSSLSEMLRRMGCTRRNTVLVHRIACTETARTVLQTVVSIGVRDIVN